MKLRTALTGLALIAGATQANAQTSVSQAGPQAAPSAAAPKSRNDPNRIICRTDDEIGSRVHKRKICMTAAQWNDVSHESGFATERKEALVSKPGGG